MTQYWDLNPVTGDYLQVGGLPVETDSLRVPAYYRLKVKRKKWLYAPNDLYGSDFHLINRRQTNSDGSLVEDTGGKALQPLLDDGRAQIIDVETAAVARHGIGINVKIISAAGRQDELNLLPLGV